MISSTATPVQNGEMKKQGKDGVHDWLINLYKHIR